MSSSGINAINSGPLIIRSYFGSSINNTYALGDNDIPISSNRVLVTSTNGLVTPSDNIYISSITISSINGLPYAPGDDVFWSSTSSNGSIVNDNTGSVQINTFLQCSTITDVSTINGLPYPPQNDTFWTSTLSGGDIVNTNTGIVNISTGLIVNNSFSTLTIFDNALSPGTTGQVLTAGPSGAQVIWSNTLNVLSISTTSISTTSISTSTINGLPYPPQNDTFWASTLSNGGITNTNTGIVYISTSLIVRPPAGEALIEIVARDGANAAALHWEQSTIGVALDMNLQANGVTIMAPYGSAGNNLITIGDPRASVGPPALLANSEIFGFTSGYQAGIATIANGTNSVSVINTNMTATSIIMFTFAYFVDATLTSVCARPFAGVGFDIEGNANATSGPVYVFYFIVRY